MVEFGKIIVIIGSLVSIALLTYYIFFLRERLEEPRSKWLLLIGLFILPIFSTYIAGNIALEEAKSVDTCNSCHVMEPYIRDMVENVNLTTLTSKHYLNRWINANQCYTCHTNYGVYGDIEAKLAGARHTYKYYTGTYETPIKLVGTYQNSICLFCHRETIGFKGVAVHSAIMEDLTKNTVLCVNCHAPVHPEG